MLRVYTIEHDGRKADIILSDRVVRAALETESPLQRVVKQLRKVLGRQPHAYREAHNLKQHVVEQFNSAYMGSAEHVEFLLKTERLKAEHANDKRRKGLLELPQGFTELEPRQFNMLTITPGRLATPQECLWFLVLALGGSKAALTPQADWVQPEAA